MFENVDISTMKATCHYQNRTNTKGSLSCTLRIIGHIWANLCLLGRLLKPCTHRPESRQEKNVVFPDEILGKNLLQPECTDTPFKRTAVLLNGKNAVTSLRTMRMRLSHSMPLPPSCCTLPMPRKLPHMRQSFQACASFHGNR